MMREESATPPISVSGAPHCARSHRCNSTHDIILATSLAFPSDLLTPSLTTYPFESHTAQVIVHLWSQPSYAVHHRFSSDSSPRHRRPRALLERLYSEHRTRRAISIRTSISASPTGKKVGIQRYISYCHCRFDLVLIVVHQQLRDRHQGSYLILEYRHPYHRTYHRLAYSSIVASQQHTALPISTVSSTDYSASAICRTAVFAGSRGFCFLCPLYLPSFQASSTWEERVLIVSITSTASSRRFVFCVSDNSVISGTLTTNILSVYVVSNIDLSRGLLLQSHHLQLNTRDNISIADLEILRHNS
jgi:hypothetical protein